MRKDIEQAMERFEVKSFGNKGNLARLEDQIRGDENVLYISLTNAVITTFGTRKVEKLPGVFALTSKRIIFMHTVLASHTLLTFDLSEIKSVSCHGTGLAGGHVEIHTMVNTLDILVKYKKTIIQQIQQTFDSAIASNKAAAQPVAAGSVDVLAQIEKLSDLKDKGILSESEYTAKKEELLSRL